MKFIEATLIMPITLLIVSGLILLMMGMYGDLKDQISDHQTELKKIYEHSESREVRAYDKATSFIE